MALVVSKSNSENQLYIEIIFFIYKNILHGPRALIIIMALPCQYRVNSILFLTVLVKLQVPLM